MFIHLFICLLIIHEGYQYQERETFLLKSYLCQIRSAWIEVTVSIYKFRSNPLFTNLRTYTQVYYIMFYYVVIKGGSVSSHTLMFQVNMTDVMVQRTKGGGIWWPYMANYQNSKPSIISQAYNNNIYKSTLVAWLTKAVWGWRSTQVGEFLYFSLVCIQVFV